MSEFIRFVERVNAVMDKEPNPHKRQEMQNALNMVQTDFNKILERTMQHGSNQNQQRRNPT